MSNRRVSSNISGNASRQVFRLSPSLHFTRQGRKPSLFFTLRARLIAAFLIVALLPTGVFAFFDTRSTQTALTNAANEALLSAANQTKTVIDSFIKTHLYALSEQANDPLLVDYLRMPAESQPGSVQEKFARTQLNSAYSKDYLLNNYILSYLLFTRDGKLLQDTSTESPVQSAPFLNLNKVDPELFSLMLSSDRPYISSVIFPTGSGNPVLYFLTNVKDESRQIVGILAARYNAALIQSFVDQSVELAGGRSYAVVYDNNLLRLAQGNSRDTIYKTVLPLDAARLTNLQKLGRVPTGNNASTDIPSLAKGLSQIETSPFFTTQAAGIGDEINAAAAIQLENKDWTVAYLQPQSVYLAPLKSQSRTTAILGLAIAALAAIFGLFITQRLTRPIARLTQTVERVSNGDLWAQAPESQDEIGLLAAAFNTMTTELRRTLEGLEQRITERTSQLARVSEQMKHRAYQLQTVTQVAKMVASIQEQEKLLPMITQLISDRFDYYHTGIFLIDPQGEYAVLRAANSEGGQRMLARNHKLKVGQEGIVGHVTGEGLPRIALDTGADATFFDNPELPNTHSEIALPLKIGDKVIGALDVQSEKPNDFDEEDVVVLSTMADQVAIAIENARLFSETNNAFIELQTLHGQYLQKQWSQAVITKGKTGYRYLNGRLLPVTKTVDSQPWEGFSGGEPAVIDVPPENLESSGTAAHLMVPIMVRGQIIGMYDLGEPERPGGWEKEDIQFVKSVADQVGLALENARLLEQTQIRAEREHLVSEITSKMRATNDPNVILETAKRELLQALRATKADIVLPGKQQANAIREPTSTVNNNGYKQNDATQEPEIGRGNQ